MPLVKKNNYSHMKKSLLLVCMFTSLVSAQDVSENLLKENLFLWRSAENQLADSRMVICSSNAYSLPDSVYSYYGEEKRLGKTASIKYDENGRKLQEKGLTDLNGDGIMDENEMYLMEYTYTSKNDLLEVERLYTYLAKDIWLTVSKEIDIFSATELSFPVAYYDYGYQGDKWVLKQKRTATGYDHENRPVVYLDSTFNEKTNGYDTLAVRAEISYNEKGLCDLSTSFRPTGSTVTGEEWIATLKKEFTYDATDKLIKKVHHSYDLYYNNGNPEWKWTELYTVEYTYDEKGNIDGEVAINEDGTTLNKAYYTNIYASATSNEAIFSGRSAVYPNPVSDVLHVAIEGTDHAVITLLNASGTVITKQKTNQPVTLLPVRSLAKGYYFVTVQTAKGIRTHKVVIN